MFGHPSRALYAVWSNPAPGVDLERFRHYYEEVHRPDTLALGHFERSFRYEAKGPCRARYLTLWEADYPDLPSALERVRKGALALREKGRVWPVQEVVFHQFVFAAEAAPAVEVRVETLTTVQNDWRAPARGQDIRAWARAGLPNPRELRDRYAARYLYAAQDAGNTQAGRFLWLGEADAPPDALRELWLGDAVGLPPFGRPTPIFPPPDGAAFPPNDALSADPDTGRAAWVVHWTPM